MKYKLKLNKAYSYNRSIAVKISALRSFPAYFKADLLIDDTLFQSVPFRKDYNNLYHFNLGKKLEINPSTKLSIRISQIQIEKFILISKLISGNGYERERELVKAHLEKYIDDLDILETLLLRLNDWVEPIRLIALKRAGDWINLCSKGFILKHLYLINNLSKAGRANHSDFINSCHNLFKYEKNLLLKHLTTLDYHASRCSFDLLCEYQLISRQELLSHLYNIKDVVVLSKAAKLVATLSKPEFFDMESTLKLITYKDIKSEYLRLHVKYHANSHDIIKQHLFSKSKGICELAYYLAKNRNMRPKDIYKQTLSNPEANSRHLMVALKMFNVLSSEPWYYQYLENLFYKSPYPHIKTKALKLLITDQPFIARSTIINIIKSADSDTICIASNLAYKLDLQITGEQLLDLITQSDLLEGKILCVKLMDYHLYEWEKLITFLKLYDILDSTLYNQLKIPDKLASISSLFRSKDEYEPQIINWIEQHNGQLQDAIDRSLASTHHGCSFLKELSTC